MASYSSCFVLIGILFFMIYVDQCLCTGTVTVTPIEYYTRKLWDKNPIESKKHKIYAKCQLQSPEIAVKFLFSERTNTPRNRLPPNIIKVPVKENQQSTFFIEKMKASEPFNVSFSSINVPNLKIHIWRDQQIGNGCYRFNEFFVTSINSSREFYAKDIIYILCYKTRSGSYFSFGLRFQCDAHYGMPDCSVYCRPQNSKKLGHYTCSNTGQKVCLKGWAHPLKNCTTPEKPCHGQRPCHNGGTCKFMSETRTQCHCPPNWTGHFCDEDRNECLENPCRNNGSCRNLLNGRGFKCDCSTPAYTGPTCSDDVNECLWKSVCKNNGTCQNTVGSYKCECIPPFHGRNCDFCNSTLDSSGLICSQEFPMNWVTATWLSFLVVIIFLAICISCYFVRKYRQKKAEDLSASNVRYANLTNSSSTYMTDKD